MAKVKFWRGAFAGYNATTHANGIYFATDTKEIWLDGKCYGGVATDANALAKAIVKAELTKGSESAAGVITLTAKDGTVSTIELPSVAAGNGVSVAVADGVYTVGVKLDATNNKLASVGADGLAVSATLAYDSDSKKLQLKNAAGTAVSELDATPFIKDGILDSVQITDGNLVFTWNTDADKTATSIALTDIFNPYTIGNGLDYVSGSNTLSAKVKEGDKYITVDANGIQSTALVATMDASIGSIEAEIGKKASGDDAATGLYKYIDDAASAAVADLDAEEEGTGTNVTVKVTEAAGVVTGVEVSETYATVSRTAKAEGVAAAFSVTADGIAKGSDLTALKGYVDDKAAEATEAADAAAQAKIEALDLTDTAESGTVVTKVDEEDGVIAPTHTQIQSIALTGMTVSTKTGAEIAATDTIGQALVKLDEDLIWNEVTA